MKFWQNDQAPALVPRPLLPKSRTGGGKRSSGRDGTMADFAARERPDRPSGQGWLSKAATRTTLARDGEAREQRRPLVNVC